MAFSGSTISRAEKPLENAHAHNDYLHERPLFEALDLGFNSVEADIFLVDGQLLVGHSRDQLKPERKTEMQKVEAQKHNAAVDALQTVADRFNEQVKVFKAKQADKK